MPPPRSWSLLTPGGVWMGRGSHFPQSHLTQLVLSHVCPAWGHLLGELSPGAGGLQVGAGCLHSQIPTATAGCVSSGVILLADVLFTFSFLQQLSVLVPGFVLGRGRICGYKTCTEASFRSERGSLCAGRYFALCSKFPFEKCQIILVNTVENPPALGLRQEQKQRGAGCREAAQQGVFFPFHCTNRSAAFPLSQSKGFL